MEIPYLKFKFTIETAFEWNNNNKKNLGATLCIDLIEWNIYEVEMPIVLYAKNLCIECI